MRCFCTVLSLVFGSVAAFGQASDTSELFQKCAEEFTAAKASNAGIQWPQFYTECRKRFSGKQPAAKPKSTRAQQEAQLPPNFAVCAYEWKTAKVRNPNLEWQQFYRACAQRHQMAQQPQAQQQQAQLFGGGERELFTSIIAMYQNKSVSLGAFAVSCGESYRYTGGRVIDRSIDGKVGMFLIGLNVTNISNSVISASSLVADLCGRPPQDVMPGGTFEIAVKGLYRKYDSGWRLEQMLQ